MFVLHYKEKKKNRLSKFFDRCDRVLLQKENGGLRTMRKSFFDLTEKIPKKEEQDPRDFVNTSFPFVEKISFVSVIQRI